MSIVGRELMTRSHDRYGAHRSSWASEPAAFGGGSVRG